MQWKDLYFLLKKNHRAFYLKALSLLHTIPIQTMVEIGVFQGKNAQMLRKLFPNAALYLIDPYLPYFHYLQHGGAIAKDRKSYENAFLRVSKLFENDSRTTIIRKPSTAAVTEIPNGLDLVFIDANHDYTSVKQDIFTYFPKLNKRAILAGHNYGHRRLPGVKQAVDECFRSNCYLGQDSVWAYIKK